MKKESFELIIKTVPIYRAIFTLIKIPDWVKRYSSRYSIEIGDEFYADGFTLVHIKSGGRYALKASYLNFKEYRII